MRYFRRPGQKISYTRHQTARYVSKRARWQRGLRLKPNFQRTSPAGEQFGFFSARGPAKDNGHWIVTLSDNNEGGGGDPANPDHDYALYEIWLEYPGEACYSAYAYNGSSEIFVETNPYPWVTFDSYLEGTDRRWVARINYYIPGNDTPSSFQFESITEKTGKQGPLSQCAPGVVLLDFDTNELYYGPPQTGGSPGKYSYSCTCPAAYLQVGGRLS